MDLRICYTDLASGNCCLVIPAPGARLEGETDRQFAERIAAKDVPPGVGFRLISLAAIPTDRSFRDAWTAALTDTGPAIIVDMPRARSIRRRQLLELRDRRLHALRERLEQALDDGDETRATEIREQRRRLRNLEASLADQLDAVNTPEELSAFVPALLA